MNRNEKIYFILACILTLLGLHALITFVSDAQSFFIYGILSIWLLLPGGILYLAAFQSKIKISTKDHTI
ncbi:MAG: hypothetical protein ACW99Q_13935 [Candidatus Kariarchaeaceae archaeon]|jgi:hypothetical protein